MKQLVFDETVMVGIDSRYLPLKADADCLQV